MSSLITPSDQFDSMAPIAENLPSHGGTRNLQSDKGTISSRETVTEEVGERQGGMGALPEDIIFRVAKQLANAICYLHKQKILHCNLKSKSIMVCSN